MTAMMPSIPPVVLAIAAFGISALIAYHILRNIRTPPGPGAGDGRT